MSQVSTLSEISLPVRWVVLFTGSKATEDYQPAASAAESPALIREVTEMCVDFHPHTDIRHFPQDGDAVLFWRAKSSGDWVVTRVTVAPNPQGLRTALEYCSVVFTAAEFAKIGSNPFHARDLHLHEKVRQAFLSQNLEPLEFDLTGTTVVVQPGLVTANGLGKPSGPLTNGSLSTPENYQALRDLCTRSEEEGKTPPTFATWWSSQGDPPNGAFEIILRAAPPKPLSLREVLAVVKKLNGDTKDMLPSAPADDTVAGELSRGVITKADLLLSTIDSIAARSNVDSVAVYQASMAEAAGQAGQIAGDVERFRSRIIGKAEGVSLDRLTALGAQYTALSKELSKVPHPDPFRPVDTTTTRTVPPPKTPRTVTIDPTVTVVPQERRGPNPMMLVGGVVVVGAIAAAAMLLKGGGNNPPVKPSPTPSKAAASSSNAGGGSKSTESSDPIKQMLVKHATTVQTAAENSAEQTARQRTKNGDKPEGSEIRTIAFRAIRDAYRKQLSTSEYEKAFDGPKAWDYDRFDKEMPKLAAEVKGAVEKGVLEGETDLKLQKMQQENADAQKRASDAAKAAAANSKPTPEPRDNNSGRRNGSSRNSGDEDGGGRRNHSSGGDSGSKSTKPPKSSGGGGGGGGGVGSTDL